MSGELCSVRPLFGGAISTAFPQRFEDVSNIRQVPDHQEVFVDPSRDESLIFELLDFKTEVGDIGSASWFLNDLASEQDAEGFQLIEQSEVIEAPGLSYRNIPAVATTAIGEMAISKGRQGREAQNLVRVINLFISFSFETQFVLYDGIFCRYMWQIFVLRELIQMS
ncbi:hypothetical protein CARUB_v10020969mg [Capsella rubella]|uniref:Uncharacterized protein n=1 Tax=Capsella rubella TaxID=81985 RepID=R0IC29_9BRAS|nr:hypothetical protein CARUB_v10020969mg [Capsella rubella]EOA35736.1 hypothetical protein CARUB_v10020969mg [Capsella rubella]